VVDARTIVSATKRPSNADLEFNSGCFESSGGSSSFGYFVPADRVRSTLTMIVVEG